MSSQSTVLAEIKAAARKRLTESSQLVAIAKVLAKHGAAARPKALKASADGATLRIYHYTGTPAGEFVLITGPSIEGEVRSMSELATKEASDGFYVEAAPAGDRASTLADRASDRAGATRATRTPRASSPRKSRAPKVSAAPTVRGGMDYRVQAPAFTRAGPSRRSAPQGSQAHYEPVYRAPAAPAGKSDADHMAAIAAALESVLAKMGV